MSQQGNTPVNKYHDYLLSTDWWLSERDDQFPLSRPAVKSDGTFRNPWPTYVQRGFTDVVKWKVLDCTTHTPKFPTKEGASALVPSVDAVDWDTIKRFERKSAVSGEADSWLMTTWCGHASFLVQHGNVNILTDPVWSERASPVQFFGPKRMAPPPMRIDELPLIHLVTISHNHYDHLDTWTVKELIRCHKHPLFIVPLKMKSRWFASLSAECGICLDRVIELDWWERVCFTSDQVFGTNKNTVDGENECQRDGDETGIKLQVTSVPAQHWSMRTGIDRFHELWCGFVIDVFAASYRAAVPSTSTKGNTAVVLREPLSAHTSEQELFSVNGEGIRLFRRIFHAGDTGYCTAFSEIGALLGPMDLSLIPIGAYAPRYFMSVQHVDPEDAVKIHLDVRSRMTCGMHWGTFILTDEPIDEPPKLLKQTLSARRISPEKFRALKHGETIRVD